MTLSIPQFGGVKVTVAGDVMVDHYWYGDTSRISPEAPVPVVQVGDTEQRAGGAANVACNVAALGCDSVLCGVVGEDEQAAILRRSLHAARVRPALSPVAGFNTISKTRIISRHQQLLRLDHESPVPAAGARALVDLLAAELEGTDLVILSDYGKGSLAQVSEMIALARRHRRPVLVDPKGRDFGRYRGATVMTPNQSEFEAVVGACGDSADFGRMGHRLRAELELDALLITRGENGMTLVTESGETVHLSAAAREVYDVTGAGDTVIAALGCALGAGSSLGDSARIANLAAGLVVSRLGAATVTRRELLAELDHPLRAERNVLAPGALLEAVALARARGERIVMTNGCFDLLHAGHVSYLAQARRLGDRLVVALNGDASVTRLKGEGRPLNPVSARAAVLRALSSVDWVVVFDEDTPEALISQVLPDVLVKGGDYEASQVAGGRSVIDNGGEVRILDFVDGYSTSAMLSRLRGERR